MRDIRELIRERRSVRTFDGQGIGKDIKERLEDFMKEVPNPYRIPVSFKMIGAKEYGLHCPVVSGTDLYIGGKIKASSQGSVAFGYSFEAVMLYAQSLGLGSVWLGGTMNRPAYEKAMALEDDEVMPCACALGYPAKRMSLREEIMRKTIKADERLPFESIFFDGSWDTPLREEKAGELAELLEMVRLAPSAVNRQPWRVVVVNHTAHFYLKRSKGISGEGKLDMQKVDVGIAICHFMKTAEEKNMRIKFENESPGLLHSTGIEYIASCKIY